MRIDISNGAVETQPNAKVLETLGSHIDNPDPNPPVPKLASTVMLVRNSAPGQTKYRIEDGQFPSNFPNNQAVEVFMLRRVKTMDFVPDAVVFPGGRVDERDANPNLPWCGPTPAQWADLLGLSEENARRVVVAAAREVFEECGVLLAGPDENTTVTNLTDPSWAAARKALEAHEIAFADFLAEKNLLLRTDLLGLIANWCTPTFEPKRYDTFFFAALMPEGQHADDNTSEAQIADWVTPSYAVRESDANRWLVVPPTLYNLTRIASAESAEAFASTRNKVKKFMFRPIRKEDGTIILHGDL
jgi:8-oxo-dGTP pyrophosphatase MutT (NUDIX family)